MAEGRRGRGSFRAAKTFELAFEEALTTAENMHSQPRDVDAATASQAVMKGGFEQSAHLLAK